MTPDEFKQSLRGMGWSQAQLARRLGIHVNTVSQWARGIAPVPSYAIEYLRMAKSVKEALDE